MKFFCHHEKEEINIKDCQVCLHYDPQCPYMPLQGHRTVSRAIHRLMAIKRHPEFLKDYERLQKARETGDEKEIMEITYLIYSKWGEEVEKIECAEEIYETTEKDASSARVVGCLSDEPMRVITAREGDKVIDRKLTDDSLYLKIDLREPTKEIIKTVKEIVSEYKKLLRSGSAAKRNRPFKVDPWQAYDMYQETKNFAEVTRRLFGIEEDQTGYGEKYKAVRRAYQSANDYVEKVTPHDPKRYGRT